MGTLAEEILSNKTGKDVQANEIIVTEVDYVLSHDTTTPLIIEALQAMGRGPWNPDRAVVVFDHIVPAPSIQAAQLQKRVKTFVNQYEIPNFFQDGICHQLMVERHFALPGHVIVGADSHSCTHGAVGCFATGMGSTDVAVAYATGKIWLKVPETIELHAEGKFEHGVYPKDLVLEMVRTVGADGATYCAIEYTGATVEGMSIEERMTLTSMAVEMGAKAGMVKPDRTTMNYTGGKGQLIEPVDPVYSGTHFFDTGDISPKIAAPHRVDNVHDIDRFEGLSIDQVFLGTCTNGRLSDLEVAARYLKGRTIHPEVRMVVVPASRKVLQDAYALGYVDIFNDTGAIVCNPGCGPCIGRHQGVLAPGEVALTTMNRNFQGRMGSPDAEVYLASPATIAASAIAGEIRDPREVTF